MEALCHAESEEESESESEEEELIELEALDDPDKKFSEALVSVSHLGYSGASSSRA